MDETNIIAYSVYATVQCECGDAFIITKTGDPIVCPGCSQVYELLSLEIYKIVQQ